YQTQLAGDFVLHGVDPYGADYGRAGLASAPWAEAFPSPALHHLVTWPGQFLLPLPLQALSRLVFGWWDERVFLLVAAVAIWLLLGALFPGIPGRMAAVALFLVPSHSLLAVLGDNDLPVLALLLAAGVIHGARDAFPFALLEMLAALVVWLVGWRWLRRGAAIPEVLMLLGLAFAGVLFVSRYFHDTHLLLGVELVLAGLAARRWRPA